MAVVGQVGCGKSTLLSAILGETEKLRGNVFVEVRNEAIIGTYPFCECIKLCDAEQDVYFYKTMWRLCKWIHGSLVL